MRVHERERATYGWRKCSKSQARRIDTDLSGRPLWGRHGWHSIMPICCNAFCCLRVWSRSLSRGVSPFVVPSATASFSPIAFCVTWIWPTIPSLRHLKCLDIAFNANLEYTFAAPAPATASKEDTTVLICSQYCLYLLFTWNKEKNIQLIHSIVLVMEGGSKVLVM